MPSTTLLPIGSLLFAVSVGSSLMGNLISQSKARRAVNAHIDFSICQKQRHMVVKKGQLRKSRVIIIGDGKWAISSRMKHHIYSNLFVVCPLTLHQCTAVWTS